MRSDAPKLTQQWGCWGALSRFSGMVLAVDVSCWMYTAMCIDTSWYGIAGDWSECVKLVVGRHELLSAAGVKTISVLDGDPLPGKEGEAAGRERDRGIAAGRLTEHLRDGDSLDDEHGRGLTRKLARRTAAFTN